MMTKPLGSVNGSALDDDGVVLVGRNGGGSVVASKWLPGPVSEEQVGEDAAHFAEDTGLVVEIGGRQHLDELIPTHIGRRLPASHSRLMHQVSSGLVSESVAEVVHPATILPCHLRRR